MKEGGGAPSITKQLQANISISYRRPRAASGSCAQRSSRCGLSSGRNSAQTTPSLAAVPPGQRYWPRAGAAGRDERAGEVSAVPDPAGAPPAQRGHQQGLAL